MADNMNSSASSDGAGRHREVVAVFRSADAFAQAVDDLQSSGVDRARLSVLATGTEEEGAALRAAGFHTVRDLLDAPNVPRSAYTQPEDVTTAKGAVISALVYVGAAIGIGLSAAAAGPVVAPIVASAVASGAAGGGIGAFLTHRFGGKHARYIEESLKHGGLALWVAVRSPDDEAAVIDRLRASGGQDVSAHDMPDAPGPPRSADTSLGDDVRGAGRPNLFRDPS